MVWVIVAVAVLLLGLAAFLAVGKLGSVPEPDTDVYAPTLPAGPLHAQDLRDLKFGVTMRGYDMKQVDALLERLADQLESDPNFLPSAGAVDGGAVVTHEAGEPAFAAAAIDEVRDNSVRRENVES